MIIRSVSLPILITCVVLGLAAGVASKTKPTTAAGPLPEQPEDSTDPSPPAKPPKDAEKRFECILKSVDYDYFGGKEKFEEMKRLAKEHSGKSQN